MNQIIRISFLLSFLVCILQNYGQQCNTYQYCSAEDLGKNYDYRGQSTISKFAPGDTCRVQAILYAGNDVRIATCSDPLLGTVQFKVYRIVREYKRIVDKIQKHDIQEPIYKLDKNGNTIAKRDDWGKPIKDFMGDLQFEIASYKKVEITDTIWKIERRTKEEILFDSRRGQKIFNIKTTQTEPIMIEMVVPPSTKGNKNQKLCVGIMVGRIFHSTNYKQFDQKR